MKDCYEPPVPLRGNVDRIVSNGMKIHSTALSINYLKIFYRIRLRIVLAIEAIAFCKRLIKAFSIHSEYNLTSKIMIT
jgi:hypothetical protein